MFSKVSQRFKSTKAPKVSAMAKFQCYYWQIKLLTERAAADLTASVPASSSNLRTMPAR